MIDDDDDGVEPQFEDVDEYYFVDGEKKPVCISILHLHFGENNGVEDINPKKKVYLRGLVDKSIQIYKNVVAWRIQLDAKQSNIFVLSSEQKWMKLLKPRKCYEEFARSILITMQMMHFFRMPKKKRGHRYLWDHLDDVFKKYDHEPELDDMLMHRGLLKLIMERDIKLEKSKVLQRFLTYDSQNMINKNVMKTVGDKKQVSFNDEPVSTDDINDSEDENSDEDIDIDNDTDQLCAICDDGGEILSCEGPCKRSFHPRKKDGRESKCKTLGYTSAQVKGIDIYLCNNCKYKQHQCFKCGELEPSDGSNAKVFQCINSSCGHYYHPKCIALLLEPDDSCGASLLEKRIMEGMPFTCPIHWCFKCNKMEDKTQKILELAMCTRCPRAYHRACLPSEISFDAKKKDVKRGWELSKTLLIYCLDHKIHKAIGTARRNHLRFPTPEGGKIRYVGKNEGSKICKRKNSTGQHSTEFTDTRKRPKSQC